MPRAATQPAVAALPAVAVLPFHTPVTRPLRNALGEFATGVTIVTALGPAGQRLGMTVNSFTSVSLKPPLVLWNLALSSPSAPAFESATHYCINVLTQDQMALAQRFARRSDNKFDGLKTKLGAGGTALLPGCAAWFECRVVARHAAGDHLIMVGEVERFRRSSKRPPPLLFHGGGYCALGDAIKP